MQLKEDALGTEKLSGLMVKMAVPSVIAQVINILYNIVDRVYIGHIPDASSDALTGVGVVFPIVTFISAFSAFVGSGGAPLSAIWQGKGDRDRAEKILGNGVTLLIFFSAALMIVFSVFAEPLLYLFGASDATVGYGKTYTLQKDSKVALLSVGYGDGVPREAGGRMDVMIRGKKAPVIGRVSMDQATIDVSDFDCIEVGDESIIVGWSGGIEIPIEEYSRRLGITPAQALTSITKRVARFYKTLY